MVCEELPSPSETAPSPELLKIDSADSSPSYAESSFRELDDAFLQTQTRIWLGEVLQIRLDEQLIISELLADGELLFQVSKVVWKLLLAKHMELRHIKAYKSQPFASKKNSGRYRPYSNVDSFLKICKIVGLTGIDLFSPSDVVERKNTRRVCMCIRSFSKKSRSMNINVPDFDIVTCMVTMPKDLVGYIRRNIELSHSILADSSRYYLQNHVAENSRQGYSVTHSTGDYETYSDQTDDAEIKHPVLQFDGVHADDLYDYTSEINYNIPPPMVENVFMSEDLYQLDIKNQQRNEISNDEFELLCSVESLQHHCSESIERDCKLTWSPSCGDLHINFSDMTSHLHARVEQVQESRITNFNYVEHDLLRNSASVIGTPMNDKTPVTRDASSHAKSRKYSDLLHEENSTPNEHQSASSHGSSSTPEAIDNGRCFEIGDSMESLDVAGMSCLSREALNSGDQFDAENNFQNIKSFKLYNDKNDQWDKMKEEYESQDIMKCKEMKYGIISNARYSYFVKELEETQHSLYSPDCYFCKTNSSERAVSNSNDISSTPLKKFLAYEDKKSQVDLKCLGNACCNQSEELLSSQSYSLPGFCKWDQKGKCAMTSSRAKDKSFSWFVEDGSHEETTPCKQKASEVLMSKDMLSCVPNKEDLVSAAVVKLSADDKERKNDCQALASNTLVVDDSEKCPTIGDDANDFCGRGVTTQDNGDGGQREQDMINNVVPANCDEDVSHDGSCIANQSSRLECNDDHQACQYDMDTVYDSDHPREVHIQEETKLEDESVHCFENLVETEEGSIEIPKGKPQKKLLLKSVLGGAAAVGLLFMFLHLRRNGGEKDEPSKASRHKGKEKIQKYSPRKVKKTSTTEGVYPAEKLKLK